VRHAEQRLLTLLDCANAIVRKQKHFLKYGSMAVKPLVLNQIADRLGIHESTVSVRPAHRCCSCWSGRVRPLRAPAAVYGAPRAPGARRRAASGVSVSRRRKTGWLQADLHAFGVDHARLPRCAMLPSLGSLAACFGCLCLLEGATPYGQLVDRHLLLQFGYDRPNRAVFFNGYAKRTAEMWTSFRSAHATHVDAASAARAEAVAIVTFAG